MKKFIILFFMCFVLICAGKVNALDLKQAKTGIRGGLGTDISGGLAYGLGVNKTLITNNNGLELGIMFFRSNAEETSTETHTYVEKTKLSVLSFYSTILHGYTPNKSGTFYITGVGLGIMSVDWEESSPTDTSLGTSLAGGGSKQTADGTTFGMIFDLGIGKTFENGYDLRAEMPLIIIPGAPGEASSFAPAFIVTVGHYF